MSTAIPYSQLQSTGPAVSGFDKAVAGILPQLWNGLVWVSKKLGFKKRGGLVAPEGMHYLMQNSQHFGKRGGSFQR